MGPLFGGGFSTPHVSFFARKGEMNKEQAREMKKVYAEFGLDFMFVESSTLIATNRMVKEIIRLRKRLNGQEERSVIVIKVTTHPITTGCGRPNDPKSLPFLTEEELEEFDSIGYSGKTTNGVKMSWHEYLDSLGKGQFSIAQTKFDNGDCIEKYVIAWAREE